MSKQFIEGNVYVFVAKRVKSKCSLNLLTWESDVNGRVVTIESEDKAFIGTYGILPQWCKCIKNNN